MLESNILKHTNAYERWLSAYVCIYVNRITEEKKRFFLLFAFIFLFRFCFLFFFLFRKKREKRGLIATTADRCMIITDGIIIITIVVYCCCWAIAEFCG